MFVGVLVRVQSALRVAMSSVLLDGHTWLVNELSHGGMGSPFDTVADGTMDCESVVCAARWSLMASGDGMAYASFLDFVMAASLSWWDG